MCWKEPIELTDFVDGIINSPWNESFTGSIVISSNGIVWKLECVDGNLDSCTIQAPVV